MRSVGAFVAIAIAVACGCDGGTHTPESVTIFHDKFDDYTRIEMDEIRFHDSDSGYLLLTATYVFDGTFDKPSGDLTEEFNIIFRTGGRPTAGVLNRVDRLVVGDIGVPVHSYSDMTNIDDPDHPEVVWFKASRDAVTALTVAGTECALGEYDFTVTTAMADAARAFLETTDAVSGP